VILIAGGTGVLGRELAAQLLAAGEGVRVLTRDPAKAERLLGGGVDIAVGDVRQPATLAQAMRGVAVVVSAVHGFLGGRGAGPQDIDVRGNAHLVDAAKTAGADVVLLSVLGASATSPIGLFRAKYAAEEQLRASGVAWTIVRPAAYLETWIDIMRQTAKKSGRPMVFGAGKQPIAFISAMDVAAVVARAATDAGLRGDVLEVSGPRLTMSELAEQVQRADGRTTAARHVPRPMLRLTAALARPVAPAFARQNKAALVMDTTDLGEAAGDAFARLSLPSARTLPAVLTDCRV
jgi:uncharacterized protein YbjT (DUF2867 family)